MASRPIFLPTAHGDALVQEVFVDFPWHPGMAPSQKQKNVQALHAAANVRGLSPLLEISSKSDRLIGQRLSAFNLRVRAPHELQASQQTITLESAFQGSKVFEHGGPFQDLYLVDPKSAKRDRRLQTSGNLTGFRFDGRDFPREPVSVFYDWLYATALFPHIQFLIDHAFHYQGFTDIEFNPSKSFNCQARSYAILVSLTNRRLLTIVRLGHTPFLFRSPIVAS